MATTTTNAVHALTYIWNGDLTARWNFPRVVGAPPESLKGVGQPAKVTFSFPATLPSYSSETGFLPMNAAQEAATRKVLALFEQVANIDFVEVQGTGTMVFGNSSQDGSAGYAFAPSFGWYEDGAGKVTSTFPGHRSSGDVFVNRNMTWTAQDWQPGHEGWNLLLHEIGHALGMKHPHQAPANGYLLDQRYDDASYTVMSYAPAPNAWLFNLDGSGATYDLLQPRTPMVLDIQVLQYLYGANTSTRSGNSVYKWADAKEVLMTIWDGGGTDTIDCANQSLVCWIDLREGHYSSIGLRRTEAELRSTHGIPSNYLLDDELYDGSYNVAIAFGTVIENAVGGARNDRLQGNAAANTLTGNGGKDLLVGDAGKDRLVGGSGNDTLRGGAGSDRLTGGAGSDRYDYDKVGESGPTAAQRDTITDFVRGADRIDLAGIDANTGVAGNQAFTFVGSTAFSGNSAGKLRLAGGVLYGSTDADTAAEFSIALTGVVTLAKADFVL